MFWENKWFKIVLSGVDKRTATQFEAACSVDMGSLYATVKLLLRIRTRTQDVWGSGDKVPPISTLVLIGGEWPTSLLQTEITWNIHVSAHLITFEPTDGFSLNLVWVHELHLRRIHLIYNRQKYQGGGRYNFYTRYWYVFAEFKTTYRSEKSA